jgi:predicted O-methyltransferase YrrM
MDSALFEAVDHYIDDLCVPADPILDAALKAGVDAGLPQIQISPGQGKLLYLLAKLTGARRILEIGALAGYSAIWLARALPADGFLVSLEVDAKHATLAQANLDRAGFSGRAKVVVGPALDSLAWLTPPFDVVFIDADKENYPLYLDWALRLARPGGLILADNVIRRGTVMDQIHGDAAAKAVHRFNAALAADPRVETIILQQIGVRGHDGLALARVRG